MEGRQRPRYLFIVDCDDTISAEDTGAHMFKLFKSKQTKDEIWERYNIHQAYPKLMQEGFDALHEEGYTPDDIILAQKNIPIINGMPKFLHTVGNRTDCDIVISSDATVLFINGLLQKHKLEKSVMAVMSNYVDRDPRNTARLVYHPHDKHHTCKTCPENMCKRAVLRRLLASQKEKGITYRSIFVVGDGVNDHCQCVLLGAKDYIMPREGFPLHKIVKEPKKAKNTPYPAVLPWVDGEHILSLTLKAINAEAC